MPIFKDILKTVKVGLGLCYLVSMVLACSKSGNGKDAPQLAPSFPSDLPVEDDLVKKQGVKTLDFTTPTFVFESCIIQDLFAAPSAEEELVLDGQHDEWEKIAIARQEVELWESPASIKIQNYNEGLAFAMTGAMQSSWAIVLQPSYLEDNFIKLGPATRVSLSEDGVRVDGDLVPGNQLVRAMGAEGQWEVVLSPWLLDRVRYFPLWELSLEFERQGVTRKFLPFLFQSNFSGSRQFILRRCKAQAGAASIAWYTQRNIAEEIMTTTESLLIKALRATNAINRAIDIVLVAGQHAAETLDDSESLTIRIQDFPGGSEFNQLFQDSQWYREALRQYFFHWLRQLPLSDLAYPRVLQGALEQSAMRSAFGDLQSLINVDLQSKVWGEPSEESLALALGLRFSDKEIISAVFQCLSENEKLHLDCILANLLPEQDTDQFLVRWKAGDEGLALNLSLLSDLDGDGLPQIVEVNLKTDPSNPDTDGDGWTDFTEFIEGFDPRNPVSYPEGIVFDGSFGEWFDLIPARILVDDRVGTTTCPGIDLAYYSGLKVDGSLYVGASLIDERSDTESVVWRISVDFAETQNFGIVVDSRQRSYRYVDGPSVNTPFSLGFRDFEIKVPINAALNVEEVSLQISVEKSGQFCDDTPWFKPSQG
ncbi:hypothetical protein SAMN06296036_101377 [Pseudobacteriovorax antillogorgiicola]|uniref:Uncharacterized protein n=1 Tax=Pseudobacteriovorax antillogorgiicola TaxID=1513793 RepID=A0A1Y6B3Z5_9BACT|nr:hypothetical protein EDD56_101109 [Pseudobacteriovorax antillogorgiicola]SME90582.1 hypothetical protein SAMN06296036_101377 [Pseudobacteriovorax antillogorgiicola]